MTSHSSSTNTHREPRSSWWMELRRDLSLSLRALVRHPAVAVIATLSTAVGIGACSLIFAVANFALFRPLPVPAPASLLSITGANARTGEAGNAISYPDFLDLAQASALRDSAAYFPMAPAAIALDGGQPRRYWGTIASANYFDVLGSGFFLGRGFNPAVDNSPGAPPVVILSHRLWTSYFGADRAIVGRAIRLNDRRVTVVGVASPGFLGTDVGLASDFWIPFSLRDLAAQLLPVSKLDLFADRNAQWLFVLGRLRRDITARQCAAQIATIAQRLSTAYPGTNKDRAFHCESAGQLSPAMRGAILLFFAVLMILAALVLLTACANVANLLLARGYARHEEIATRMALGAKRSRLVRQLLTENIVLALPGGVLGCLLACLGARAMRSLRLPVELPVDLSVSLDWRLVLFCAALALFTGIVFGLAPTLQLVRRDMVAGLANQFSQQARTRWWSLRNLLTVTQIAICVVLLACAGLFWRSLRFSQTAQTGMERRDVGFISFDPSLFFSTAPQSPSLDTLLDKVRSVPGVRTAALTTTVPLSMVGVSGIVKPVENADSNTKNGLSADIYNVSPGFFATLGIRLLAGEDFRRDPGQDDLVILNMAAAASLFPGQNAIGRQILIADSKSLRVIGVVATSKSRNIVETPRPCLYQPLAGRDLHSIMGVTLMFRSPGDPTAYLRPLSDAIHAVDPGVALFDVGTMEQHLSNALLFQRIMAMLLEATGATGLFIAAFGIYGVVSFLVARQTKEIGIRIALGASRRQILVGVLRKGLSLSLCGILIGLFLALLVARGISAFLYGVTATDPMTFAVVPLLLLPIVVLACLVPALRAANADPLKSIRYQ